jgi:hypothetical protein
MEYKIIAVHRRKAADKGFPAHDLGTWVDILCQWLYSIGAKSCGFTSEGGADNIVVFAEFDPEPDDTVLGDIVIQEGIKTAGPLRLENYDPYTMMPVLAAWRHMQKSFLVERNKTTNLLKGFVDQVECEATGRRYYPPDRIERMIDPTLKFPVEP